MPATIALFVPLGLLFFLAAANGANDVSRAAATLLSGGITSYRRALGWVVGCTLLGSLLSNVLAAGVAHRFAAALSSASHPSNLAICSVIGGATLWIVGATAKRLPVATTHAIVGSLLGVGWLESGGHVFARINLWNSFALPLLTSPLISLVCAFLLARAVRCVALKPAALNHPHWISCGLVAFTRGVNDSAKIWALVLPLSVFLPVLPRPLTLAATLIAAFAMLAGGIVAGRRVTSTVAYNITEVDPHFSAVANLTTAAVILSASLLTFPVASSHIVTGSILGVGVARDYRSVRWSTVFEMSTAWIFTLPASALLSAGIFLGWQRAGVPSGWIWLAAAVALAIVAGGFAYYRRSHVSRRIIVFVCSGNTSRSPMAAMICRALLSATAQHGTPADRHIEILSRGLSPIDGKPLTPLAARALSKLGVKPRRHLSECLTTGLADKAAVIYCMTEKQVAEARAVFRTAADKIELLVAGTDIPDPSSGGAAEYAAVATLLQSGVRARLAALLPAAGVPLSVRTGYREASI